AKENGCSEESHEDAATDSSSARRRLARPWPTPHGRWLVYAGDGAAGSGLGIAECDRRRKDVRPRRCPRFGLSPWPPYWLRARLDERGQRLGHLNRPLIAILRILGHHLGHYRRQFGRYVFPNLIERVGGQGEVGLHELIKALGPERWRAGQQVIER